MGLGEYNINVSSSNEFFDNPGRCQKKSYDYQYANTRWLIPICGKESLPVSVQSRFHHRRFDKQYDDGRHLQSDIVDAHCQSAQDAQNHSQQGIRGYGTQWVLLTPVDHVSPAGTLPVGKDVYLHVAKHVRLPNAGKSF